MPRQAAVSVENHFTGGLITDSTGLSFPENSCTEVYDCELIFDGSIKRRLGFDFEDNYTTKTINRNGCAVVNYLWRNVAGNGDVTLLVVQVGATIYFYKTSISGSFSPGAVASTVTLTPVSGAPATDGVEAQFTEGNGLLIITHPYCEPIRVSYDTVTDTATATNITIKIRDFEGAVADPYAVDERPTSTLAALNVNHIYNLLNQGWTAANLTAWDTAQTTMPSNADVQWLFRDATNNFDASAAAIARVMIGNTAAPKGHYIMSLSNQDRATISGQVGVAATTTGSQRPSTSVFFAGRIFYSGVNYVGFNSSIFFTQIIERVDQYGNCYQTNDPTAENLFDLLPSDGGVIVIPECGTIYKLMTVPGGLCVFAANGVWFITGSAGIGFIANDYTVQKISNITTLTAASFVNVAGWPSWWNGEGIYIIAAQSNQNLPSVKCISDGKIRGFYRDTIPIASKRFARGFYHDLDGHIRWLFKSESTVQLNEIYEYDRVLNFNIQTGAFYPWRITDSNVKVHAIITSDLISSVVKSDNVIANAADQVIDGSSNNVIAFTDAGVEDSPFDKYLVSYADGGTYKFTFSDKTNANYLDWFKYDNTGVDFTSYFITGYKIRGQAIKKFQDNWIRVFSNVLDEVAYYVQGVWDFATTGSGTGKWSTKQYVAKATPGFSVLTNRLKVRGHGLSLQIRVESVPGKPFEIIGWSCVDSGNAVP